MEDPTRPSDGPAWAAQPPLESASSAFVHELTHEILTFMGRRALPFAEALIARGDDPSYVVVLAVETLRGLADGLELGGLAD